MLHEAAHKRTEYLVLEASLDTEQESVLLDLPDELVLLLQNTLADEDVLDERHNNVLFGYLLTWMLTFDLFTNAVSHVFLLFTVMIADSVSVPQSQVRVYGPSAAHKPHRWPLPTADIYHPASLRWRIPRGQAE